MNIENNIKPLIISYESCNVIPAKAGIQVPAFCGKQNLDSRFRGNDIYEENYVTKPVIYSIS